MRILGFFIAVLFLTNLQAQTVRFETTLGNIDLEMLPDEAPKTVTNFMAYLESGAYDLNLIHRSVTNFVVQGGWIQLNQDTNSLDFVPTEDPVENEFSRSNTRGTVAMAKVSGDPDSATSQWFFNVDDNSSNLDFSNGGFTVFAEVTSGMEVVDAINALQTIPTNLSETVTLNDLPVLDDYEEGEVVTIGDLVFILDAYEVEDDPDTGDTFGETEMTSILGSVDDAGNNWYWSFRHQSFLFALPTSTEAAATLWDSRINSWMFTGTSVYPWTWYYTNASDLDGWVFFFEESVDNNGFRVWSDTSGTVYTDQSVR